MINKNKLKNFLSSSDYSEQTKLFVIKILDGIAQNPIDNAQYVVYLYDLDLFEEGFVNLPSDQYFLIDFNYLEKLSPKIRKYYLDILTSGVTIDNPFGISFTVNKLTMLTEHGILISNIEHLKRKRQQKLQEVEARKLIDDEGEDEYDGIFVDDDDWF